MLCRTNVLGNIRSLERKFRGIFVPGSICSGEFLFQGAYVPSGNFRSDERKYRGAKNPWTVIFPVPVRNNDNLLRHQWSHICVRSTVLIFQTNLLMKLAGSSWGANANTLRSFALALCYSVAEYCCPVWQRSTHVSLVDAQLHSSMRLISGIVRSTPLPWLPVLTNIEPPALRRRAATDKLIMQAECHRDLPLYDDIFHPPPLRLESRKPL